MGAPDKIYLQWDDGEGDEDYNEITWCIDQIDDTDVEYSRVTLAELAALRHIVAIACDVNEWLKTIDMGGTGHQRGLESALAELDKCVK